MKRTCSTPGCVNPVAARGYCAKHRLVGMPAAVALATEIDRLMTEQARGNGDVARAIGSYTDAVRRWRLGSMHPTLGNVEALADELDAPLLVKLAIASLTRRCSYTRCRKTFVVGPSHRFNSKYHSPACREAYERDSYKVIRRGKRKLQFAKIERAIAAMCRGCEPFGICRDNSCSLRPVSPLPFVPLNSLRRKAA